MEQDIESLDLLLVAQLDLPRRRPFYPSTFISYNLATYFFLIVIRNPAGLTSDEGLGRGTAFSPMY